jgi:hypothetical protein
LAPRTPAIATRIGVAKGPPSATGSERFPPVGKRRIEMEMRIVVGDAGSASTLAERLTAVFGTECISLWVDRPEVEVRVEGGVDRSVLRVLDAVDRWLDQAGLAWAELWLGERSFRVARSAPSSSAPGPMNGVTT